ncbi:MAG: hypothetical protein QF886_24800, partial [Planctomycetota bacterium]|nr:hypothetical protein [Planctomycetota bacterium]
MSKAFKKLGSHERTAGWSLIAIMALYQATNDPLYLEAARRIAAVPLREQRFDLGGAWPHVLPRGHDGGHRGAKGNNLFLIGILLSGLKAYHEVTGDEAAKKSILSGARWLMKSWNEAAGGWPYSATTDGAPLHRPSTGLNPLVIESLTYAAHLSGDASFIKVVDDAFESFVRPGPHPSGKSLAQKMVFTGSTMALLQKWHEEHSPDKGLKLVDGGKGSLEKYILRISDAAEHMLRSPNEKIFWVRLRGAGAGLRAKRTPHGARPKGMERGFIQIQRASGEEVLKKDYSTDDPWELKTGLTGKADAGEIFKVTIRDDQRAHWSLFSDKADILAQAVPSTSMARIGQGRFYFSVPEGVEKFRIRLIGVHSGTYGGAVLNAANRLIAYHQGVNPGQVQLTWAPRLGINNP